MELKIPLPVTFNPHKHHLGFLKLQIETWKQQNRNQYKQPCFASAKTSSIFTLGNFLWNKFVTNVSPISGNSQPGENAFTDWLGPHEYRKIRLSDSSVWVVKKGVDPERYIHIHPGKHSPFSTRVRATTLKTVIALQVCSVHFQNNRTENLRAVNETRVSFLKLSPVKSIQSGKGIEQLRKRFAAQLTEAAPRT
jgi:hypothetical protein